MKPSFVPHKRKFTDFLPGDQVVYVPFGMKAKVTGKSYGRDPVRFEIRCENGAYVRDLRAEDLKLSEEQIIVPA